MISGHYPFLGDTLQETYDKIANDPVQIPGDMNPQLADLIQRLLSKIPGIVSPCRLWRSILGLLGTWAQFLNTSAGVALAAERGMIFGNNYNNKASPDGLV